MFRIDSQEGFNTFTERLLEVVGNKVIDLAGPCYVVGMELPKMPRCTPPRHGPSFRARNCGGPMWAWKRCGGCR